jgi:ribosomal protein L29
MDKIIVEYQLKLDEFRKELDEVRRKLSDTEKQVETSGSKMSNTFKNVGKAIAAAFTIREVVRFGQEAIKLAATMEGVENAFNRLGQPGLLDELRKATKGTVSDLELMQNAVKANNFQIPLDKLGKMFQFAAMRARETGESVDYLVESITLGIARKSIPILDNLGISSIQIQEEFKKTGDFAQAVGNIIDESMGSAGETVETTAEKMERMSASFKNFQVDIGERLLPLMDILIGALEDVGDGAVFVQDRMFEFFNFLGSQKAKQALESKEAQELVDTYLEMGLSVQELTFKQRQLQDGLASIPTRMGELRAANEMTDESYKELVKAQDSMKTELLAVNTVLKIMNTTMTGSDDGSGDGGASGALKELKYDFDALYPPVDAITKAMEAFGQQFAFIRSQVTEGIDVGLDLDRTAGAILNVEKSLQQLKDTNSEYVDTTQEAADWTQAWFDISSNAFMGLSMVSDQQTQKYIDNLQAQFDAGQITQEQFDRLQDERLRKNARQQKSAAIFDIILSTAQAIMNALTIKPASAAIPASIAAGVAGAIQLGVAVNAPLPAFAEGVVGLNGEGTETSDSILARLSKGESVITAKGTRQDKGLFEAANKMKLEEYINKNYVLPVLLKKQQEDKAMFDDYRLYRSLQDLRHSDKANTRMIVNAIKTEKVNSRRYWA